MPHQVAHEYAAVASDIEDTEQGDGNHKEYAGHCCQALNVAPYRKGHEDAQYVMGLEEHLEHGKADRQEHPKTKEHDAALRMVSDFSLVRPRTTVPETPKSVSNLAA